MLILTFLNKNNSVFVILPFEVLTNRSLTNEIVNFDNWPQMFYSGDVSLHRDLQLPCSFSCHAAYCTYRFFVFDLFQVLVSIFLLFAYFICIFTCVAKFRYPSGQQCGNSFSLC